MLNAQPENIRALEPLIRAVLSDENICVIGNEQTLEKESEMFMALEDLF